MNSDASLVSELTQLPLGQVRLGGRLGRRIELAIENHLLQLDLEQDFIGPFRQKQARGGYVGLGKTIEAFARFAAHTQDPRLLERCGFLVDALLAAQAPDGYLGCCAPDSRMWPLWDLHEMAYLIQALTVHHRLFGEARSIEGACRAANYILREWRARPDAEPANGDLPLYLSVTGLDTALVGLYQATHEPQYLEFAADFLELAAWDSPVELGRWGKVRGHAYGFLSRCHAQLNLYRITADPALLRTSRRVMEFLLDGNGLTVVGSCGWHECWHNTQEGGVNHAETCATAYLLRWWEALFQIEAQSIHGDLIERAMFNALLGAQSPDGRHIRYFTPFDGPRQYFNKATYCCPGNFRRILAQLPQMLYYQSGDTLLINQYASSRANRVLADGTQLAIEQDTNYPREESVTLKLELSRPARFSLMLRVPRWCSGATVAINGTRESATLAPGEFVTLEREWRAGDTVVLNLPMQLRLVQGRAAQTGRAAVMRGPMVYTLSRHRNPVIGSEPLRYLTIDPDSLRGPFMHAEPGQEGLTCAVRAWRPSTYFPHAAPDFELTLTEFPDPTGEHTYFLVPNPIDSRLVTDELISGV